LLRTVLSNSDLSKYDYIFFDCPPSLNVLTVNALIAADSLIIPLQSEFFALEGLSQLLMSVREVRGLGNPALRIEGVALTMFDGRNRLSLQVEADARENLGELVFKTMIPRNVRISEAPSFSMPVLSYDSRSKGAAAYRALAQEVLLRQN
jgi:chromosome partitioning protein